MNTLKWSIPMQTFFSCLYSRICWLLIKSQTSATRMWLGLASISLGLFLYYSDVIHGVNSNYKLMLLLAPEHLWIVGYLIHGLALWYGVFTQTYNKLLLVLEGVLGTAIWSASAITVGIAQGAPGALVVGALMSLWLLVRYPTHWEYSYAD